VTYADYARSLVACAKGAPTPEWTIVMYFYAAVHATNSILYAEGAAPLTHTRHEFALNKHPTLSALFAEYEELKTLSLDARYRPQQHPIVAGKLVLAEKLCNVILAGCNLT